MGGQSPAPEVTAAPLARPKPSNGGQSPVVTSIGESTGSFE